MIYKTSHINLFIGIDENKKILILPYVWNRSVTKIKVLTDNTILNTEDSFRVTSFEKHYNLEWLDSYNLSLIVSAETITDEELNTLIGTITKFYETENKIVDTENKNAQSEEYKNF